MSSSSASLTPSQRTAEWFYKDPNNPQNELGPFSADDFRDIVDEGEVEDSFLVHCKAPEFIQRGWIPFSSFSEIRSFCELPIPSSQQQPSTSNDDVDFDKLVEELEQEAEKASAAAVADASAENNAAPKAAISAASVSSSAPANSSSLPAGYAFDPSLNTYTCMDPLGNKLFFDYSANQWRPLLVNSSAAIITPSIEEQAYVPDDSVEKEEEKRLKAITEANKSLEEREQEERVERERMKRKREEALAEAEAALANGAQDDKSNAGKKKKKSKKKKSGPNTTVYVEGLPTSGVAEKLVLETLTKLAERYGVIRIDPYTGLPKVKLYHTEDGSKLKGDAVITYLGQPSVPLALQFLDSTPFSDEFPSHILKVTEAKFEEKSAAEKETERKAAAGKRPKINQKQALAWDLEKPLRAAELQGPTVVIIKNMFTLAEVEEDPLMFATDLKKDIMTECGKLGQVTRCKVYDTNAEGVVMIRFKKPACAEACVELMNGRFFGGRELTAEYWDGVTLYNVKAEGEEDDEKRWEEFGKILGGDGDEEEMEQDQGGAESSGSESDEE